MVVGSPEACNFGGIVFAVFSNDSAGEHWLMVFVGSSRKKRSIIIKPMAIPTRLHYSPSFSVLVLLPK